MSYLNNDILTTLIASNLYYLLVTDSSGKLYRELVVVALSPVLDNTLTTLLATLDFDDAYIVLSGATILYDKRQRMGIASGETGRSSVLLLLMLVVTNNSLTLRTFNFRVNRVVGDDVVQFYNYRSLKITEVQD